jgi:hypothetical protein
MAHYWKISGKKMYFGSSRETVIAQPGKRQLKHFWCQMKAEIHSYQEQQLFTIVMM